MAQHSVALPLARHSLRLRLTVWYTSVLLAGLILFGLGTWFVFRARLMSAVDKNLDETLEGLQRVYEIEGAENAPNLSLEAAEYAREVQYGKFIQLSDSSGKTILPVNETPLFPAALRASPDYRTLRRGRSAYRVLARGFDYRGTHYAALAAAPLDDVSRAMNALRDLMLTLVPVVLLAAFGGGYWISRRALAPVDEMTRSAASIGVQNLSQRLPVPSTGDELERLSRAWNELLERLESSVKRIQQFTADASHELRTPLTLIRSTAELALRREREPAEYRQALHEIGREAERMTELTEALLAQARADAGGVQMDLAPVDLNGLASEVAEESRLLAEGKGIHLEASACATAAVAQANEAALRRLLRILVDNALEHTPAGGRVSIAVARSNGHVTLAVRDSGEGIPPEALPHIFERFYRVEKARGRTQEPGKGVGLGLALARSIAQAHGTEIEVESKPGEGACFRLELRATA